MPARRDPEQDAKEEATPFLEENGKYFWSMSGDFAYRHDVHRRKLYIPGEAFFSVTLEYVDVTRQTRTSIDNTSEHTLNDYWNVESEREVLLSEEWIRTARLQKLRVKLPEEFLWVEGRPTQV